MRDFNLRILPRTDMSRSLQCLWRGWETLSPTTTLFVIPGNGARDVEQDLRSQLEHWPLVRLVAARQWTPGEAPRATTSLVYTRGFLFGFKDVVIIDDVVASGATIQAVKRLNEPWIPGARWHILTWVLQRSANTSGFESAFASVGVGERGSRRSAINSLSTLLDREDVAESYATRNFSDRADLFLEKLRRS